MPKYLVCWARVLQISFGATLQLGQNELLSWRERNQALSHQSWLSRTCQEKTNDGSLCGLLQAWQPCITELCTRDRRRRPPVAECGAKRGSKHSSAGNSASRAATIVPPQPSFRPLPSKRALDQTSSVLAFSRGRVYLARPGRLTRRRTAIPSPFGYEGAR